MNKPLFTVFLGTLSAFNVGYHIGGWYFGMIIASTFMFLLIAIYEAADKW